MEFWKKYFFKVGVFYYLELDKELREENILNKNTNNYTLQ